MYLNVSLPQRSPNVHAWLSHWLLRYLKEKNRLWGDDSDGKGAFHESVRTTVQTPETMLEGRCAVAVSTSFPQEDGRWKQELPSSSWVIKPGICSREGRQKAKIFCLKQ